MWGHSSCKLHMCIAMDEPPAACVFCCSRPALILAMRRIRSIAAMRLHPAMLSRIKMGSRSNADTASCVSCDAPQMDSFKGCAPSELSDLYIPHAVCIMSVWAGDLVWSADALRLWILLALQLAASCVHRWAHMHDRKRMCDHSRHVATERCRKICRVGRFQTIRHATNGWGRERA